MAYRGAWRPVLEFLSDEIAGQTSIRDYIDGEKVIQGFVAAYLSATEHFVFHTERELGGGYADICLEPRLQRYAGMRQGYVIEFKYLKRGEPAGEARVARAAATRRGATWRTSASIRRYGSAAWPSCSTVGSWCTPSPCPSRRRMNLLTRPFKSDRVANQRSRLCGEALP